jgi:hypothetical protein
MLIVKPHSSRDEVARAYRQTASESFEVVQPDSDPEGLDVPQAPLGDPSDGGESRRRETALRKASLEARREVQTHLLLLA